jgi:hypothetical protein
MTQRYAHLAQQTLHDAAELVPSALKRTNGNGEHLDA